MTAYKYDTHVHTAETSPCGRVPAVEMVRLYSEAGYRGVAVTDHFSANALNRQLFRSWDKKVDAYLKGYQAAVEAGKTYGLDIIFGIELTFDESANDYLVFGIDEQFLRENKELYRLGLESFRKLTAGGDVLIFQAHPFRAFMTPAPPALIDGVEIYNGNPRHDSRNDLAGEYARKNGLLMSSGSDFHQPADLARGGMLLPGRIRNQKELVQAFRRGLVTELIQT